MTDKNITTENNSNEVCILCMMFGTEIQIYGIFSDKKLLLDAYNKLLTEDARCSLSEKYPQKPIIYKVPFNSFTGRKEEWCRNDAFIFYDEIEQYEVSIDEIFGE